MVDSNAKGADIEIPVLIVGAGPAGLTLALALARCGVAALTVEKHPSTAHTPRAHIINQRTVEIFRALGISEKFHEVAIPQSAMTNNLWYTTLADPEVARSETWGGGPGPSRRVLPFQPGADGQLRADGAGTDAAGRRP